MAMPVVPAINKNIGATQRLSRKWGDCGNTASAIVEDLGQAGFTITTAPRRTFPGAGQNANAGGAALSQLLLAPVNHVTLFNIDIDGVHIFVLEKHPNGTSMLTQGYRGTYFPWWWQGLSRTVLSAQQQTDLGAANTATILQAEQPDGPQGAAAGPISQRQATYGLGQNLGNNLATLANNLATLVQLDYWGGQRGVARQATVAAWQALPFHPGDTTVIGTGGRAGEEDRNPIRVTVDTYTVTGLPGGTIPNALATLAAGPELFFTARLVRQAKIDMDVARYGAAVVAALG